MDKQIVINGNLISYIKEGAGDRFVIFLHGWRSNKEVWEDVIQKFMNQVSVRPLPSAEGGHPPPAYRTGRHAWGGEYGIYALDFPGFGGSPAPKKIFSVEDYAEVVQEFIEKLELKNVIIVGHSFGGRVGIKLCAMMNTTPSSRQVGNPPLLIKEGIIEKLVLVDSAGFVTKGFKKDFFRLLSKIAKPFFKFSFTQGLRKKIYQFIGAEDYLATPDLQKTFVNVVNEDLTKDMKRIAIPTLIIWGENDKETPVEFGKRMFSLISAKGGPASGGHNSKFIILPGSGHFSFLDKPEEFVGELSKFISS